MPPHPLEYMKRALQLARRGTGLASPNPMVGAPSLSEPVIVGEGFHVYEKRDHAEVLALRQAGKSALGADLYVTLEPCVHVGRTPPCVQSIIGSGIRRVFVATKDPNPLVSGRGVATLREAGIEVVEGLCVREADTLNEKFFHFIRTGQPFVLLKLALSLDGRIATCSGESKWITGPEARSMGHRLRFECDAVLVGIRTVLIDDPLLSVRGRRTKRIVRIILDSELQTPASARLFSSPDPVMLFHSSDSTGRKSINYPAGAELVAVDRGESGLDWSQVLDELGRRGISSVLVEGGSRVAASALTQRVVQKLALFYGPKVIGGDGLPGIGVLGVRNIADAIDVSASRVRRVGSSLLVEGYPRNESRTNG